MTTPTTAELLKYADLQMAAEAFIRDPESGLLRGTGDQLIAALTIGNKHASKFTETQAIEFEKNWKVLDQMANTPTGFSGTLFENRITGELVMSFRSTEFIDDAARDNQATNVLEIKETGFAWGQIRDMEEWYANLILDGKLTQPFSVTGYSLGGHLATEKRGQARINKRPNWLQQASCNPNGKTSAPSGPSGMPRVNTARPERALQAMSHGVT